MRNCKKSICIVLSVSLILCLMPWKQLDANISDVEEHSVSNPRVEDGISTWDCIYFGYYYQSNDAVKEPIKWRVLSVDGDDAFLLADKNLDCKPYNNEKVEVTWETCSLRHWLNDIFLNNAFTEEEKSAIQVTIIKYTNTSQKTTEDKIYLLSPYEAQEPNYGFSSEYKSTETRVAENTLYTKSLGAATNSFECGDWWLRYAYEVRLCAAWVSRSGICYYDDLSAYVSYSDIGVRPCLHLDLSSSEWSYAGTVSSNGEENALPSPTPLPTATPTAVPTATPTPTPTVKPTPTVTPTVTPTQTPSNTQTPDADNKTTPQPTNNKSISPTSTPVTAPSKPTKLSAKNNKKKTVTLTWKKVKGAKGYQVQYAINTVFSKRKTKTTTKTKLGVKSLKKKKTYSFRVRAYKLNGKKKVYGKWSTVKRVKIKK